MEQEAISGRARPMVLVWSDRVLAVAVVAATAGAAVGWGRYSPAVTVSAVVLAGGMGVLVVRRRYPLLTLVLVGATAVVEASLTTNEAASPLMASIMFAEYSLGGYADRRSSAAGVGLGVLVVFGAQSVSPPSGYSAASSVGFFAVLLVLVPFGAGRIVRSRRALGERLSEITDRLHELATEPEGSLVAEERARLGRSLEATALSGLDALASYREVASLDEVEAIETTARRTLSEVRGLLVGLRGQPDPQPAPALGELRARVEAALVAEATSPQVEAAVPGRWSLVSDRRIDRTLVVAGALYAAAMVATTVAHSRGGLLAASLVAAVSMGTPVVFLRRAPLAAAGASVAVAVVYSALAHPADPSSGVQATSVLLLAPFALGIWEPSRLRKGLGVALCFLAVPALVLADRSAHLSSVGPLPVIVFGLFAIGVVLRARSEKLSQLADAALRLNQARKTKASLALRAERAKVARELHDALAHSLTAILLQATAARRVWQTNPDLACEHTNTLRTTLAVSAGELRQLVVALTLGSEVEVGFEQISRLAEQARASGLGVVVRLNATPAACQDLDAGIAAYRITQEALTNAARHAPGSQVTVEVSCVDSELRLRVTNGSPTTQAWPVPGAGHGIAGMRERARTLGGCLDAAPVPGGGFAVTGRIPLKGST
ncbi:MAG TPA: histidine kinase [Solirubrobacteraceae bacterium]|nr:histidine kinase [Solirubrobacteraceae bacterium]